MRTMLRAFVLLVFSTIGPRNERERRSNGRKSHCFRSRLTDRVWGEIRVWLSNFSNRTLYRIICDPTIKGTDKGFFMPKTGSIRFNRKPRVVGIRILIAGMKIINLWLGH
ncbi:hypothetical protein [Halobellus sp. EA9]|uniref:hypothetical protein n=1 Tax=Halobellus sp. EA9 TaxID=3421647 RepID=UPI003EB6B08B